MQQFQQKLSHVAARSIALAVCGPLLMAAQPAVAQTVQDLSGVWVVEKIETLRPDGSRVPTFGDNPHTQLILMPNGRFSQVFIRSDLPKFASGNRLTGTPEENAAVVKGSNVTIGTWSLADKTVTLKVEASTYPNWNGTNQPRPIVSFSADQLMWTVALPSGGGTVQTIWKRVK